MRRSFLRSARLPSLLLLLAAAPSLAVIAAEPLAGTKPLAVEGDLASLLVEGADRFLLRKLDESPAARARHWKPDFSSAAAYVPSVEPNRKRLAKCLGVVDPRAAGSGFLDAVSFVAPRSAGGAAPAATGPQVRAVRWPVFREFEGAGLLLLPAANAARPLDVIVLPDAGQSPEMLAGLAPGLPPEAQSARRLWEAGCRVLVPVVVDRGSQHSVTLAGARKLDLTHREFLYRPAFEMGRHLIGYELQQIFAAIDLLSAGDGPAPIGVFGAGEGGLLTLYAAALDPRIAAAGVSGYFDSRQNLWQEPLDRNVFGLLDAFDDARVASLIAPRALVVEAAAAAEVVVPPGGRGGPGEWKSPPLARVRREVEAANRLIERVPGRAAVQLVASGAGDGLPGSAAALERFLVALAHPADLRSDSPPERKLLRPAGGAPLPAPPAIDPAARLARQVRQIEEDTQHLMRESEYVRDRFWSKADRRSVEAWKTTTAVYREHFATEVIGRFDDRMLPPNPRTRQVYDQPQYLGYEVVLDVFPELFAYGVLLMPKGIPAGERRPVIVCQHGLEGRPQDVADPAKDHPAYHQYACKLAEQGFIVFAPQNLYIFKDRFRTLQRKANPLGKTLFSLIVPQHQQIVDWLAGLPQVDPERIAFYGLSYGGKTAMRVPALVERYCLSICSADFNEWIWKNASTRDPYSYVNTGEYEIFEFDLGQTYNYAEMAGLIAPRGFMVERGHRDGVAPDPRVAYEYAKVRLLYADLKIPERTTIEFFDGPHTIHGVGTFDFLKKQLKFPAK